MTEHQLDTGLKAHVTDRQWEILEALHEHGTERKAAKALGISRSTFHTQKAAAYRRAAKAGYAPANDMTHTVPEGFMVKGVSTLYDSEGNVTAQWVKSAADRAEQEAALMAMVEAFKDEVPRAKLTIPPKGPEEHLLAGFPIGDHHMGMLAWAAETDADYDMEIAQDLIISAMAELNRATPPCGTALVAVLGDYLHYDSFMALTPTNRNLLDTDTRFPKMVRAAVLTLRAVVDMTLLRHGHVHVILEIGNHDPSATIFLMECIRVAYENDPRVTVNTSPKHFHYFEFGKVLIGTHHGHSVKMDKLPMVMAADVPQAWGRTSYRYWWTGHIHHDHTKDYAGTKVESFRVLPPTDAWANQNGYRAQREMKAIVFHQDFGEVARYIVNPEMLGGAEGEEGE